MTRKLNLIAGHSDKDPGALGAHTTEAKETRRLRDAVYAKLNHKEGVFLDDDSDGLKTVVKKINERSTSNDITISIHFNAFNHEASGTKVLVYHGASEEWKEHAKAISSSLANQMGIPDRGVSYENSGAHSRLAILNDTVTESMLLEVMFVDNPSDVEAYEDNFDVIVNMLVVYINILRFE